MDKEKDKNKINTDHEFIVDTKDSIESKNDELTNRINRLYGISSDHEEEQKQYDPKELEEARKKLIFLLMGVVLGGIVIFIILINPFGLGEKKKMSSQPNENKVDENEDKKEEDNKIPVGEIALSNSTVISLNNFVSFTNNDFLIIDLFPLYSSAILDSNNIPNDIKLYLLRRSNYFREVLRENGIEEYLKTCDTNGLIIEKEKFDKALNNILGPNVVADYKDINYSYYSNSMTESKLTLNYINNQYVVKCNNYQTNTSLNKYIQQKLINAIKTENTIELYQKVVFINPNGVYKDPSLQVLITNDKSSVLQDYIDKGSTYKYIFTQDSDSFYLSRIELVKDAN